jgi:hypothetical protein
MDHIESTSTQFSFNFRLCIELDQKITRLVHKTMFNNNIKYFFITFIYIYIYPICNVARACKIVINQENTVEEHNKLKY